jgi:hypothetical protein
VLTPRMAAVPRGTRRLRAVNSLSLRSSQGPNESGPRQTSERKMRAQLRGCLNRNLLAGTMPFGPGNAMNYTADPGKEGLSVYRRSSVKIGCLRGGPSEYLCAMLVARKSHRPFETRLGSGADTGNH